MLTIIILSIVGAILSAVIGTIWYSNATPMGRIHMEYLGFNKLSEEEQKAKIKEAIPTMPKIYGLQFLLSLLTSFAVVFIMIMSFRFWRAIANVNLSCDIRCWLLIYRDTDQPKATDTEKPKSEKIVEAAPANNTPLPNSGNLSPETGWSAFPKADEQPAPDVRNEIASLCSQ
jgi:hypothetical protein